MTKRQVSWVLALGLVACHRATPRSPSEAAPETSVVAALRADMVGFIERDAPAAQNGCGAASALLSAARAARGDEATRLRQELRAQLISRLGSENPACWTNVAARLVPLLPDAGKREVIGALARQYEKGLDGWALYTGVMPAIAPHVTADEARRFLAATSTAKRPNCSHTATLAHLAAAGRAPPAEAFAAMKDSGDQHCLDDDELDVLRFADTATLRALYPGEMALLDQAPATFALEHVRALALLGPYLEPTRRRALLAAAFRAMRTAFAAANNQGNPWGELPPEAHFFFAMMRLAPLVDAGLVDAALAAAPPAWPPESRGYAVAQVAAALPAPLRRARLRDILAAIPGPETSHGAAAARLELADDLPADTVGRALEVVIRSETLPSERAAVIAGVLRALPPSSQPDHAARIRADVVATESADSRIAAAAQVLDRLDRIHR